MKHNCGLTEIDFEGNILPEEIKKHIMDELEKNDLIVTEIFHIYQERELLSLRKTVEKIWKREEEERATKSERSSNAS